MDLMKDIEWIIGILCVIAVAYWRFAVKVNKAKEQVDKVQKNEQDINQLQTDMSDLKEDINEIKEGVDAQARATTATLSVLQSILLALHDKGCDIGPAREKFNEFLSDR